MSSRLWKIYKFDEKGYEASRSARDTVNSILLKANDLWDKYRLHERQGEGEKARIFAADASALVEQGLYLQDKLITPFTYDVAQFEQNLLLNEGITALQNLLTGAAATAFNNANSYLAVGDSSTAASATQTGLQASTNKLYKAVDANYPSISNQTTTWQSTFQSGDANFAWNEFTVASGSSDSSTNLNRKVSSQGTKASGQVWTLQLAITWS